MKGYIKAKDLELVYNRNEIGTHWKYKDINTVEVKVDKVLGINRETLVIGTSNGEKILAKAYTQESIKELEQTAANIIDKARICGIFFVNAFDYNFVNTENVCKVKKHYEDEYGVYTIKFKDGTSKRCLEITDEFRLNLVRRNLRSKNIHHKFEGLEEHTNA